MKQEAALIIDTETTGTKPTEDGICQLAAVLWVPKCVPTTVMLSYCNPGKPIPKEASDIHHITDAHVQYAPSDEMALANLDLAISELEKDYDLVISGYNSHKFDVPIISERHKGTTLVGRPHADLFYAMVRFATTGKYELKPDPENPGKYRGLKLGDAYVALTGKASDSAHDAAFDCHMVAEMIPSVLRMAGVETISELAAWLAKPMFLPTFPWGKHALMDSYKVPKSYIGWCLRNWTDIIPDMQETMIKLQGYHKL